MFDKMSNIFLLTSSTGYVVAALSLAGSVHVCDMDLFKSENAVWAARILNIDVVTTWWLLVHSTSQSRVGMLPGLRWQLRAMQ